MKRFYKAVDAIEEVRRILGGNPEKVSYEYKTETYTRGGKTARIERMFYFDDDTALGNVYDVVA